MTDATDIEWTDRTWNVIRGCSRVSEGCRNCYAQGIAARFNGPGQPYEGLATRRRGSDGKVVANWTGQTLFVDPLLLKPFKWKAPQFVFVNSMSDLFHETVTDDHLDQVFAVMALCPQHTFQILTKRPERMREYCRSLGRHHSEDRISLQIKRMVDADMVSPGSGFFYSAGAGIGWHIDNVWLGVSVEDQAAADERIPVLLDTPAAVRWISYEPALGPMHAAPWLSTPEQFRRAICAAEDQNFVRGDEGPRAIAQFNQQRRTMAETKLDWVVAGGESGHNARPADPDWFRSLRDQCKGAGVPFLFKQWGAFLPVGQCLRGYGKVHGATAVVPGRMKLHYGGTPTQAPKHAFAERGVEFLSTGAGRLTFLVGKKAAGRLLDGRTHDDMPGRRRPRALAHEAAA